MERTRWYKDIVFYQIWPRSFKDGNGDGMGGGDCRPHARARSKGVNLWKSDL